MGSDSRYKEMNKSAAVVIAAVVVLISSSMLASSLGEKRETSTQKEDIEF